jgi:YfiH family protein
MGGVSQDIFSSMNLGNDSSPYPDSPTNIEENYKRIANQIGTDVQSFVISKQVHKTNIKLVNEQDRGKGLWLPRDYDEIDGLITNVPNITLVTKYADCVPLFFVDTRNKAIGLTHSGWRGTVKKIGKITVEQMQQHYGSDPKDIIAVIGPSICQECYEIGEEVATEFQHAFSPLSNTKILLKKENGKYLCNLWEANRAVLEEAELSHDNIHISGVCTSCNSTILFSHRKLGSSRGSLAAFLSITK